jgi:hypothetical protein
MKLTLKTPLSVGKTTVGELTFRDYTIAEDYLAFDTKGGVAQNIALIAALSGTDETLIRRLRGPDYRAATRLVDKIMQDEDVMQEGDTVKKPDES